VPNDNKSGQQSQSEVRQTKEFNVNPEKSIERGVFKLQLGRKAQSKQRDSTGQTRGNLQNLSLASVNANL